MKKIALILAFVLVFALSLVACDETPAESSNPATESTPAESTPVDESTPAESTPVDESEPADESAPEYVKNPDAVSTEGNNVAAGKTYEISEQFRMSTETWGWDETFPVSYPDENYELTDGYVPTNDDAYSAACWMAFHNNTPAQTERGYATVKMDLGEIYELSTIVLTSLKDTASGITCPYKIEYLVSEDGENWYSATVLDITADLEGLADNAAHTLTAEVDVTARYLEIRLTSYGWAFLGELEVK